MNDDEARELARFENSPLYFIQWTWGLVPQPLKPSHRNFFIEGLKLKGKEWDAFCATVRPEWFMHYVEGSHLTWQQSLVIYGIEKALRHEVHSRLSIVSGHGTGKSTTLSMIILWFLFVHPDSQIPCTAPTATTLYDVLWKEVNKWLTKMPAQMANLYEWQTTHIRMREHPETWFARAKTSSKENTEALAGVHADWVLAIIDEASGVEEQIFETMEGSLTSGNILVIMTSNGTRNEGYFYDSHHKDKARWQTYSFSSIDSPRVDEKFVQDIISKYGDDSVQYDIRVKGLFPAVGLMDDAGYVQLFNENELHFIPFDPAWRPVGRALAALDASGEGQDTSEWAIRDRQIAAIVATEQQSTPASMAVKSMTVCDKYNVDPIDFVIDAFGKGHQVSQEIALSTFQQMRPWRVSPINTGDMCEDEQDQEMYLNIRAMTYYKMMLWSRSGGEFMDAPRLKDELLSIRFRRTQNGRIQIMSKTEMKKKGYPSPNKADALSMTFLRPDGRKHLTPEQKEANLFKQAMQKKKDFQTRTSKQPRFVH
ncbi:MAG: hypothetical protein Q7S52_05400 [bacterium]|nr:hypothetical protein [bacterium]